ncbi:nucleoside recognition domain-containing protein [Fretibacterium sp. OH1220_COT-178]|uniref:nucleoside recognition domain-containing protein n=1 Tax=Fretibacterium sp. OH1220_COT-178 TaxID=2491047 RepID=UPI000F5F8B29|nr:nucleoside recognition domain-containing protein [Fretibacterium sp. OH1220_COT-178]RRD64016.1 nucleoside recognition protein [Fretibacterium sp. OH1220_COT-178]
MINIIWFGLLFIGIVVGMATGNVQAVTDAAIKSSKTAVELSMGLIGVMALWLGMMKVAEASGLVRKLALALKPLMVRLFPDVPADHPAMGSILMNLAANVFGLGNAATPLGIKAMQDLQTLNTTEDTATDSMCMFLAINTSSVTLIPATTIAYRVAAGSTNAVEIIGPAIFATFVSTTVAVISTKIMCRMRRYRSTKPDKAFAEAFGPGAAAE